MGIGYIRVSFVQVTGQIREGVNQELRRMIVREVPRAECRVTYGNDYRLQHDHICLQSVVTGVALCAVRILSYRTFTFIALLPARQKNALCALVVSHLYPKQLGRFRYGYRYFFLSFIGNVSQIDVRVITHQKAPQYTFNCKGNVSHYLQNGA